MTAQSTATTAAATDTTKPARDETPIDAAALVRDADTMSDAEVTHILAGLAAHAALDPDKHPYFPKVGRAFIRDLGTLVAAHQARKEQERRTAASAEPIVTQRPNLRHTIEVTIPEISAASSLGGFPVHVDSYVLSETITLMEVLVLAIDPYKDDGEDVADKYRMRARARRFMALIEDALVAHHDADYGEQCRAEIAELDETDARHAANDAKRKRDAGDTAAAPSAPAAAVAVRAS